MKYYLVTFKFMLYNSSLEYLSSFSTETKEPADRQKIESVLKNMKLKYPRISSISYVVHYEMEKDDYISYNEITENERNQIF